MRHSFELSDWQVASARRLNFSMLLATLIVAALLSLLRFPTIEFLGPLVDIVVDIIHTDEPVAEIAPVQEAITEPVVQTEVPVSEVVPALETVTETAPPAEELVEESAAISGAVVDQSVDWETEKTIAVQNAIDEMEKIVSVNPNFDARRRGAAIKFRPSEAPVKKEIWDYVEKDQIGRNILRYGNFYRVLDDPSAVNQYAFKTFEQYMVYWTYRKYVPKELPWVQKIRDSHAYLRVREDRRNGIFKED